jgi:hypothetical protein
MVVAGDGGAESVELESVLVEVGIAWKVIKVWFQGESLLGEYHRLMLE